MYNGYSEAFAVATSMTTYGGAFERGLGQALSCADSTNVEKIKTTWPELWQRHVDMAQRMNQFTEVDDE